MYRKPLLMPISEIQRARMIQPTNIDVHGETGKNVEQLVARIRTLTAEISSLQTKLKDALSDNVSITEQLDSLKLSVKADKEKRALALFKKRNQVKKATTTQMRKFMNHTDPLSSDDE